MRRLLLFLVCGLACVLAPPVAAADSGDLLRIFRNPNPGLYDAWFGSSIAVSGDKVLIAAPNAPDENGQGHAGAAYLFDGNTGDLLRTFRHADPSGGMGYRVATFGDDFLIRGSDGVHLFDASTAESLQTFTDPVSSQPPIDQFGSSMAALGGNVLIGDRLEYASGQYYAGAVYLFDGSTGQLVRTFSNPDPATHNRFGHSIAAVGASVLVGAYDDDPIAEAGVAYLFDGNTGDLLLTLNEGPYDPEQGIGWRYDGEHFGQAVAAYGDDLLIAGESHSDSERAGVFLFDGSTGGILRRLMYPGFDVSDNFGVSLAVVGRDVLVGSMHAADGRGPISSTARRATFW